ncbi:hypothetical protein [Chryseobacterium soli]|uniref:hypothetical protein n=1 Tax=Chryseobacterium soli TaxID=445961 RepID=UPI0013F41195|nr:hypothetical protein [Chryseobacterium soli]
MKKKLTAVSDLIPVIKPIKGKVYIITTARSTKVSRIPKEYFPLRLIDYNSYLKVDNFQPLQP